MSAHDDGLRALLDRAAARHGGWDRWRRLEAITLRINALDGLVPRVKGLGATFPTTSQVIVDPRRRRMVAYDYPEPGRQVVFDRGRVGSARAGAEPSFGEGDYRARFRGLAKLARWSPANAVYFFGYALSHYLSLPFSLDGADIVEHLRRPGHPLPDVVTVRYAPGSHTHGARERFHFDETGLLIRHDYHAEILGPGANGAHFTSDYVERDGLLVARRRDVFLSVLGWASPLPVLRARLDPVAVTYEDAAGGAA